MACKIIVQHMPVGTNKQGSVKNQFFTIPRSKRRNYFHSRARKKIVLTYWAKNLISLYFIFRHPGDPSDRGPFWSPDIAMSCDFVGRDDLSRSRDLLHSLDCPDCRSPGGHCKCDFGCSKKFVLVDNFNPVP